MTYSSDTTGAHLGLPYDFSRQGYARTEWQDLSTADVEHATVYDRDDNAIGTVSALMVDTDGRITDAVIDVGGFLGMGVHSVKLPFRDLTVLRETAGSDVRVHLDTTKEHLKAMPHYMA